MNAQDYLNQIMNQNSNLMDHRYGNLGQAQQLSKPPAEKFPEAPAERAQDNELLLLLED